MKLIPLLLSFLLIAPVGHSQTKPTQASNSSQPWKGKLAQQLGVLHGYEATHKPMKAVNGVGSVSIPGFTTVITPTDGKPVYTAERHSDGTAAATTMKAIAKELKQQKAYKVYDSNNPAQLSHFTDEYGLQGDDVRIIRLIDKKGNNIAFITQRKDGIFIAFE